MFLTPLFEVKMPANDKFLSLSMDKDDALTVYKYVDGNGVNTVKLPQVAFKLMTLATLPDGTCVYMATNGDIVTTPVPQGI